MSEPQEARAAELEFIEALYGDPIRSETVKAGRNLIILGLLLISVVKFGAQVQATSLLPISFKHPDVLPTVLSSLVVLLLINFVGRLLTDAGLVLEGEKRIGSYMWRVQEEAAIKEAREVDDAMEPDDDDPAEPDPWWDEVARIRVAAKAAEEDINHRIRRRRAVWLVRNLRASGEALAPLAIATWALVLALPLLRWPA